MPKGNNEILKERCPHCKGDVLSNYKNCSWLGKCLGCHYELVIGRKPAGTDPRSNAEKKRQERFVERNFRRDTGMEL